jgi:5'(3')-deoxyribonucleotidase
VRRDLARRAVQVAVDAALGEVSRQVGEMRPTLKEARSTGIAAGETLLRPAATRFPTVALDSDGILSDFTSGALRIVERVLGRRHVPADVTMFDFTKALGLSPKEAKLVKDEIGKTRGFAAGLAVYPGAVDGVRRLREIADVHVVTSPWNSNETWYSEREEWLYRNFGIGHDHVTHTSAKYIADTDVLIDDKASHVAAWLEVHPDRVGAFWRTPHNTSEAVPVGAHSITSWDAIVALVEEVAREREWRDPAQQQRTFSFQGEAP